MKQVKINFIEREKIAKAYKEGVSTITLAEQYGVYASTISSILKAQGVEVRNTGGGRFDNELADTFRKEYEAGATTYSLAKKYNTSKFRVADYIRRAGGTLRPKGARPRS